ncbi:MAG TPA: 16S rRNA (guanine(527)-N(7))-methyltransferase RsmG [Bacteroidales bacterium]|nr:16S rRNA (guanine(527)-N(7))-methyltransferase RsmG [Bacteroidales bacterium]HPE55921.1 16S rRNA (guanine(527)-N(7))-methyltransferase RsmG [Bacteroidales bacterium]HRX96778.1 16S rRNA (guanine(527)-N(7))-methyltransferase RsmG [Bacteroidales bacterium]
MERILKYFPHLSQKQIQQFEALDALYKDWNGKINVISRKDIDQLYERHVLHSLGVAKVISFKPGTAVLDVGTGGGFPGIPLAILFPEANFHLIDSIGKKIKVVNGVAESIGLSNISTQHCRAEDVNLQFDFIVSRAVTALPTFMTWVNRKIKKTGINALPNGVLYLKGGDIAEEIVPVKGEVQVFHLSKFFDEPFFETKKVVYINPFAK